MVAFVSISTATLSDRISNYSHFDSILIIQLIMFSSIFSWRAFLRLSTPKFIIGPSEEFGVNSKMRTELENQQTERNGRKIDMSV